MIYSFQVTQEDKTRSVKTKQIGFQSESNKTEAYNYLQLLKGRPHGTWNQDKNYQTRSTTTVLLSTACMIGKRIIARTLKTGANVNY